MGYKTDCPFCGGNNFYVTEELSYCFSPSCNKYIRSDQTHTQEKKVRSVYINEIRAFYKSAANYYHSALTKEALQFLYRRGLNDAIIQQLKIGYCPSGKSPMYNGKIPQEAGLATIEGKAILGNRVTFPYMYDDTTIVDIRGRDITGDDPLKYKSPWHGAYYRGADYPYNYHLHKSKKIIITEGEIKADLAVQAGYPTIALPGMGTWKTGFKQTDDQETIILFDSQYKNIKDVRTAIIKASMHLYNPKVATLPLFGEQKMDIDQFIVQYGKTGFDTVVSNALPFETWKRLQRI